MYSSVVVTSVVLINEVYCVVLVYSSDTDSDVLLVSSPSDDDIDVETLAVSSIISVVLAKLDTEESVVNKELSVASVLELTVDSVEERELSDALSVDSDSVVGNKSVTALVYLLSPEPFSSIAFGSTSPPISGCVKSVLPIPEPVNTLVISVSTSIPVVMPEPSSPDPVSRVMSDEVLILETELDTVSEVESVASVVSSELCELEKSEELVSDEESVLLDASLPVENSDELPTSVGSEICSELAVDASRLALDEVLPLLSLLEGTESVEL